jgi:hypothetical protein
MHLNNMLIWIELDRTAKICYYVKDSISTIFPPPVARLIGCTSVYVFDSKSKTACQKDRLILHATTAMMGRNDFH